MATRRKATREYKGILARGIEPPVFGILDRDEDRRAALDDLRRAREAKLAALFAHFSLPYPEGSSIDIALACYHELVLYLASEHVPGFQIRPLRGAPRTRNLDGELYLRVRIKKALNPNLSVDGVCKLLAKRGSFTGKDHNTLRKRFTTARKNWDKLFGKDSDILDFARQYEPEMLDELSAH